MLSLNTQPTYASQWNAQYNNNSSNIISLRDRWLNVTSKLTSSQKNTLHNILSQHTISFRNTYPNVKIFKDLPLAEAVMVPASSVAIDVTMQRLLDINWVLNILGNFKATRVVPIQVYRVDDVLVAWDGQHTAIMLWLIITQIFAENPDDCYIPVNIYRSSLKNEMRENFVGLNSSESKKQLEAIDLWMQQIYGVRIDGSNNPTWVESEVKQQSLENNDLFVTASKFHNTTEPSAISRLQEINKLNPEVVGWLAEYLSLSTGNKRAVEEKEIMMMSKFFDICRLSKSPKINVDSEYITELYTVMNKLFGCDFEPSSIFWAKASSAYYNWHKATGLSSLTNPRFNKEPLHGMPFLIEQLKKSFSKPVPTYIGSSEFVPNVKDLF